MYIFGRSHIENVYSWQKMTDTIVILGEPAVQLCKNFDSSGSEFGKIYVSLMASLHVLYYLYICRTNDP
jgi:hypothetical protein